MKGHLTQRCRKTGGELNAATIGKRRAEPDPKESRRCGRPGLVLCPDVAWRQSLPYLDDPAGSYPDLGMFPPVWNPRFRGSASQSWYLDLFRS